MSTIHIINSAQQALNGVTKDAKSGIARTTQPSSKTAGQMIVVQTKFSVFLAKIAMSTFAWRPYRCGIDWQVLALFSIGAGDGNHISQREFVGASRLFSLGASLVSAFSCPTCWGGAILSHVNAMLLGMIRPIFFRELFADEGVFVRHGEFYPLTPVRSMEAV